MKKFPILLSLLPLSLLADEAVVLEKADTDTIRARIGAAYRGGMGLSVKGHGMHASSSRSSSGSTGSSATAGTTESSSLSFGYTDGDKSFQSSDNGKTDSTWLGTGTIHADGTYSGGDYSAIYDDVYFSDNRTSTSSVKGKTSRSSSLDLGTAGMAWQDDTFDGWGVRADAELPLFQNDAGFELAAFAGLRGYWAMEASVSGNAVGTYSETTKTTSGYTKTTSSFYDVTAPKNLDGTLDLANAEVFQGSSTTIADGEGKNSSKTSRSQAGSAAKLDMDADLYQAALGVGFSWEVGRFALGIRPSLLLNLADIDLNRTEVATTSAGKSLGAWSDSEDDAEFTLGVGVDLDVAYALDDRWSVFAAGGYEYIDPVEMTVGPSKAEIDFSAWTASVGIAVAW